MAANPLRTTFAAATARGVIGDLSAQRMEQGSGVSTVDRQRLFLKQQNFGIAKNLSLFLYTAFTNLIALVTIGQSTCISFHATSRRSSAAADAGRISSKQPSWTTCLLCTPRHSYCYGVMALGA